MDNKEVWLSVSETKTQFMTNSIEKVKTNNNTSEQYVSLHYYIVNRDKWKDQMVDTKRLASMLVSKLYPKNWIEHKLKKLYGVYSYL